MSTTDDSSAKGHYKMHCPIPTNQIDAGLDLSLNNLALQPVLPPELTDRIIDFCHEEPSSLAPASLVCRSFLPACRMHLFANLVIYQDNVCAFVDLLQDPLSTIPHSSNILQISVRELDDEPFQWITDVFIPAINGRMTFRGLLITSEHARPFPSNIPPALKAAFPSITALGLYPLSSGNQYSMADVIEVVDLFSETLHTLLLTMPVIAVDDSSKNHLFPKHLKNFTLRAPFLGHEYILPWLGRHLPAQQLDQLHLSGVGGRHIEHPSIAHQYLCNHTVRVMSLQYWNLPKSDGKYSHVRKDSSILLIDLSPLSDYFDLSDFQSLEVLIFYVPYPRHSTDTIFRTLQTIHSKCIRRIILYSLSWDGSPVEGLVHQFDALDTSGVQEKVAWSAIDSLLISPRFSTLVKFHIYLNECNAAV